MRFSEKEIKGLLFSWILLSIAFAILLTIYQENNVSFDNLLTTFFLIAFLISGLTLGLGFILHELMHKFVAQNYGLHAEFQPYYRGIYIAIALAFIGIIFAAPGAVMIWGRKITKSQNGKISIAGPITNIILAILFLIPLLIIGETTSVFINLFLEFGLKINAILAVFNMIPVMPFDGSKVIAWNKPIYYITVAIAAVLAIYALFFF